MRFLYTLLLGIAAPFLLWALYRHKEGKPDIGNRWREHFGITPPLAAPNPIWIHAVSVGEVIAAKPLIYALQQQYPDQHILITTTTATGAKLAANLGQGIEHRYMPIDFPFAIRRFLATVKPQILLIMETELWLNSLIEAKKARIPVLVLNARLSERSKAGYQKFSRFFSLISANIDHIYCQFAEDAQRFIQLGVSAERTSVCGSLKFDLPLFDPNTPEIIKLKQQIGTRKVWIGASTHQGEDDVLLQAHQRLLTRIPDALLILVPRHPERFQSVGQLVTNSGLTLAKRSQHADITANTQVYLGDCIGEMMQLFAIADIAFVAGSLLGDKVGGHNLLEPASLAKPILTGPSYFNFQVIGDALINAGACWVCENSQQISDKLEALFADPQVQTKAGEAALTVVNNNRGAVAKTLAGITHYLPTA